MACTYVWQVLDVLLDGVPVLRIAGSAFAAVKIMGGAFAAFEVNDRMELCQLRGERDVRLWLIRKAQAEGIPGTPWVAPTASASNR